MESIAGGSSSGEVCSTVRRLYLKVAGPSVTLLQPPLIVLVRGEEPTDEASPDDEKTVSAFSGDVANPAGPRPETPEPGPSHSAGTGDGEGDHEDVKTLYKRYLRTEIGYRLLKMRKLHKEIALLDRQLDADQ